MAQRHAARQEIARRGPSPTVTPYLPGQLSPSAPAYGTRVSHRERSLAALGRDRRVGERAEAGEDGRSPGDGAPCRVGPSRAAPLSVETGGVEARPSSTKFSPLHRPAAGAARTRASDGGPGREGRRQLAGRRLAGATLGRARRGRRRGAARAAGRSHGRPTSTSRHLAAPGDGRRRAEVPSRPAPRRSGPVEAGGETVPDTAGETDAACAGEIDRGVPRHNAGKSGAGITRAGWTNIRFSHCTDWLVLYERKWRHAHTLAPPKNML